MHLGSFDDEPAMVELMNAYLEQNGYVTDINKERLHHEIYMSDARKVAPDTHWKYGYDLYIVVKKLLRKRRDRLCRKF